MKHPDTRNTINMEDAQVLSHESLPGDQHILRLLAPETAAQALPGSFVHLVCDPSLPMRRPMSIMRADKKAGWLDILYKAHGLGTSLLAKRKADEIINLLGPIGKPFKLQAYRKQALLIGGGVGIPPMIFLAEHMKKQAPEITPVVIMGSEVPFPFPTRPSQILVPGISEEAIATMPLLDDWGIACRLSSLQGYAGCYQGYVTDLARDWLSKFGPEELAEIEIFSCGPTPMLEAVARLAHDFDLPCQISLEEYMACGVGGCAGCAVPIMTQQGPVMQRVCVDGPVFEAGDVYPVNQG